jgi:hypothetical protein
LLVYPEQLFFTNWLSRADVEERTVPLVSFAIYFEWLNFVCHIGHGKTHLALDERIGAASDNVHLKTIGSTVAEYQLFRAWGVEQTLEDVPWQFRIEWLPALPAARFVSPSRRSCTANRSADHRCVRLPLVPLKKAPRVRFR